MEVARGLPEDHGRTLYPMPVVEVWGIPAHGGTDGDPHLRTSTYTPLERCVGSKYGPYQQLLAVCCQSRQWITGELRANILSKLRLCMPQLWLTRDE